MNLDKVFAIFEVIKDERRRELTQMNLHLERNELDSIGLMDSENHHQHISRVLPN